MDTVLNDKRKISDFDNAFVFLVGKLTPQIKAALFGTLICGVIAHGMMLFNKYSLHDDVYHLFNVGYTFESGRWMLGILGKLEHILFGGYQFSMPLFNGLLSLVLIAISTGLVVQLLQLHSKVFCFLLGGIMVTFPGVTAQFGYMFTTTYYNLAMLMMVVGVYMIICHRTWYTTLIAIFLFACATGVYQAYIPVALSLMLIAYLRQVSYQPAMSWKVFVGNGLYYVVVCVGFILLYFAIMRLSLKITGLTLVDYLGINTMGQDSFIEYFARIGNAYAAFWRPEAYSYSDTFLMRTDHWHRLLIIFTIVQSGCMLSEYRKTPKKVCQMFVLIVLLPLAFHFSYVMSADVHALMVYGRVFFFVYVLWMLDQCSLEMTKLKQVLQWAMVMVVALFLLVNCRISNSMYLKVALTQERTINYLNTLITQIKSVDGYRDELPVAFIEPMSKSDETLSKLDQFESMMPFYEASDFIRNHATDAFMEVWCGYAPNRIDSDKFETHPEVRSMPCYPDDGSIQIIDDVIVVKFAEVNE